jgi:hypothetical protein
MVTSRAASARLKKTTTKRARKAAWPRAKVARACA